MSVNIKPAVKMGSIIFTVLIALQLILLSIIGEHPPNNIDSPFLQFYPTFINTFSDNPAVSLKLWFSRELVIINHIDAYSSLSLWTLAFYPVTLLVYALSSLLTGSIVAASSSLNYTLVTQAIAALIIATFGVTYIAMIEHCAGPTWVLQVALIAKHSVLFNPKLYWYLITHETAVYFRIAQWALTLIGGVWLIVLYIYSCANATNSSTD